MHRICVIGNDDHGRKALAELGLSVRAAKYGSRSWRFETCRKNFGELMQIAEHARVALDGEIVCRANLNGRPLPFVQAGSIRAGMIMVDETGHVDIVERIEWEAPRRTTVYDLDVCPTHNFIAEGIVTHNSIYAFRGALARNMQDFAREFGVAKVIRLEQNYRSQSNILEAANALIRHNRARLGKNLWTEAGSGEPLKLYEALNDLEEADFVVDEVKALHRAGLRLSEIALLYRSNAQSRVLEHALFSARVPYRVYGGLRFFERQEVKHTLAYLRLVADPNDEGALLRVVNFPARGIGARTLEQIQDRAREKGVSLWQAALAKTGERGQPGDSKRGVEGFVRLIETMRADSAGLPLPAMIGHVVEASGLRAFYQTERDGADRLANLDELVNAAALFAAEPRDEGMDPLIAFIAHAALEAGEHEAPEGGDALQLMTVHAAKGLEFKTVFISGLEEGLFPHENSLSQPNGVEEERRLMYVALTRARERLYLSYAQSRMLHGQTRYGIASRFLIEIPGALVKRINVATPTMPRFEPDFPKPQRLREPAAADNGFRVGQNVLHPKFGAGVIVNCEGRGAQARVQVNFRDSGLKWLALEYAKLSRV